MDIYKEIMINLMYKIAPTFYERILFLYLNIVTRKEFLTEKNLYFEILTAILLEIAKHYMLKIF